MIAKSPKLLALSLLVAILHPAALRAEQKPAPPFEPTLPWMTDLDKALAAAKRSGKPILAEFR